MGVYESSILAAYMAAGISAEWVEQALYTALPSGLSDGADLQAAVKTLLAVSLREDPAHRTSRVRITTTDLSGTYTLHINANTYAVTGTYATRALLFAALVAAAAADPVADVSYEAGDTVVDDALLVEGKTTTDYYFNFVLSAGATDIVVLTADALTGTLEVFGLMGGSGAAKPVIWYLINGCTFTVDPVKGWVDRFDTGSLARLAAKMTLTKHGSDGSAVVATAQVAFGPSVAP